MVSLEYLTSCGFNIEDYIKEFIITIGKQDSKELTITPSNGDYLVHIADGKTTYNFGLYLAVCETESGEKEWFNTVWQKQLFAKINRSFIDNATKLKQGYLSGLLDYLVAEFNSLSLEEVKAENNPKLNHEWVLECLDKELVLNSLFLNNSELHSSVMRRQKQFGDAITSKVNELLAGGERTIDDNGAEVFCFSEEQYQIYNFLIELNKEYDFTFRYQIFKLNK